MPQQQVVLDLETQKTFQEVGDRSALDQLKVSVVGLYLVDDKKYWAYDEGEVKEVEKILQEASRIIGFNIRRFDFPVLTPYLSFDPKKLPMLDILEDIEKKLGHRVSLNSVARATLNSAKSGSGLDAIEYYRNGEIEKLKKYCLDDVRLTYEVYEYGKKNKQIYYLSKDETRKIPLPVDWSDPPPPSNLSLF